jgi:tripeptide aminopeptidase
MPPRARTVSPRQVVQSQVVRSPGSDAAQLRPGLPTIDESAAIQRVMALMAIPGKSGQEAGVVGEIRRLLIAAGVPEAAIEVDDVASRSPIGGDSGNLIVKLPGTIKGPRRLLMAHVDTVPLCVGCKPVLDGKQIRSADPTTALGGDDRSGASVVLTAITEILKQGLPHPPLTLFWPVQEEIGLFGARLVQLSRLGHPKMCFNWDGGDAGMACIGATGSFDLEIRIDGIASHAGVHPEAGVNALTVAALAIADLEANGWLGLIVKGKHRGTSNLGIVQGGDATNVVMSRVELQGEVRSHDPKFRLRLADEFRKAFERAVKRVKNDAGKRATLTFEQDLKYESFALDPESPCVRSALAAAALVGVAGETRISNGGLDANWLSARGLPTVTMGSGQEHVHTTDELLYVDDYLAACRIAVVLATGLV